MLTSPRPQNFPSHCVGSTGLVSPPHPCFPTCSIGNPGQCKRAGVQGLALPHCSFCETFPLFHQSPSLWLGLGHLQDIESQGTESWAGTMQGWDLCWVSMKVAASQVKPGIWAWRPGLSVDPWLSLSSEWGSGGFAVKRGGRAGAVFLACFRLSCVAMVTVLPPSSF